MTDNVNPFSKILVAFDGSTPSMDAVDYAIEISMKYESSLTVIHVIDGYKYPYLLSSFVLAPTFGSEKYDEERKKFQSMMKTVEEKYYEKNKDEKGTLLKTEIVESSTSVAATIVEYGESHDVNLIIVGSRGRTGFKKMLIGSVASDVLKYAHSPVLIVR